MDGLRPIVVALIFVGGIEVMLNALFSGNDIFGLDWFSVILFVVSLLIIWKWKPNPVIVILGGGLAGGIIRLILHL